MRARGGLVAVMRSAAAGSVSGSGIAQYYEFSTQAGLRKILRG
jgi:hypothetical protein